MNLTYPLVLPGSSTASAFSLPQVPPVKVTTTNMVIGASVLMVFGAAALFAYTRIAKNAR